MDGCTKKQTETVDQLSMTVHLSILRSVTLLLEKELAARSSQMPLLHGKAVQTLTQTA